MQAATTDIFHGNEMQPINLTYIVDGNNIWVMKIGSNDCLALETLDILSIKCKLGCQHFEGNLSLKLRVISTIDSCHTATPNFFLNMIAAQVSA